MSCGIDFVNGQNFRFRVDLILRGFYFAIEGSVGITSYDKFQKSEPIEKVFISRGFKFAIERFYRLRVGLISNKSSSD